MSIVPIAFQASTRECSGRFSGSLVCKSIREPFRANDEPSSKSELRMGGGERFSQCTWPMRATLRAMQASEKSPAAGTASATRSSFEEANFATLLASLAAPQSREAVWNDEELADDVATVDYGRAMRAQARVSRKQVMCRVTRTRFLPAVNTRALRTATPMPRRHRSRSRMPASPFASARWNARNCVGAPRRPG